ncbi:FAD-binding oxidoreductase [Aspergillus lucknowensis]|uniref:FAD-binding PCMH-type domain-containing protein n=1 Tax=Aspergillus lucknowensis TaxID=176173 RepID=A0ABR4LSH9_9EURO
MHASVLLGLLALAAVPGSARTLDYPFNIAARTPAAPDLTPAEIISQLGPQLSANSSIFADDDRRWANATERWQAYSRPNFVVVAEPATEADVPVIVKYANSYGIPFLAVNRGHGSTKTLGNMQNGIEISLAQLRSIQIAEDEKSALFGGGAFDGEVMDTLWEKGFVTGTGSCSCVSLMGPGLGGGHGRYQGFYGLIIDMLISLNVVLADGSTVTVNETSHPDLWWAMRGAGHNFGIVTSFEAEIHPRTVDEWFINRFIFTQDKLEAVFEVLNEQQQDGGQPQELMNYLAFSWDEEFSTTEPILDLFFHYVGSAEDAAPHLEPWEAIGPLSSTPQSLPYPEVPDATGTGLHSDMCQHGNTNMQFPFSIKEHNITATRQLWDYYVNVTTARPEFQQSIVVFQAYSLQGVQAVDPDSTAFPHRDDRIQCDVLVTYEPDDSLDEDAIAFGKQLRQHSADGHPGEEQHVYVNYAFGDEPVEQMYGYEPWRLERLRETKTKYDPDNVFRFYNSFM